MGDVMPCGSQRRRMWSSMLRLLPADQVTHRAFAVVLSPSEPKLADAVNTLLAL